MVMKPEPLFAAVAQSGATGDVPVILLSPRGRPFQQAHAERLSKLGRFILVAGHYEGVDQRVIEHLVTEELSIGDYVLSSGELAAMVVADAVVRLVPGALASESTVEESFSRGLLEYPQYTRPAQYMGWNVPEVLLSGNHGEIARWRREQALRVTLKQRPDLLATADLSREEQTLVERWTREAASGAEAASGDSDALD